METEFLMGAVKLFVSYIQKRFIDAAAPLSQDPKIVERQMEIHLRDALSWSSSYQVVGMSKPADVGTKTIPLSIATESREFGNAPSRETLQNEKDILNDVGHHLILGDPGSGKTTTLKRLVRHVLLEPPESHEDVFQYPIVVRLRELPSGKSLVMFIADALGLRYDVGKDPGVYYIGEKSL